MSNVSFSAGSSSQFSGSNTTIILGDGASLVITGTDDLVEGGSSVTVVDMGSGNTVSVGDDSSITLDGASYGILAGNDDTGIASGIGGYFNITGSGNSATVVDGGYIGIVSGVNNTASVNNGTVTTLDDVGVTIIGSGDQINGGANSNYTVNGSSDVLIVNQGTTGFVNGTGDTLNENGSGDQFNVQNNGTGGDTVNLKGASGDYVGLLGGAGYTVVGSSGTVATWDNTSFSVTGDNDVVSTDAALDGTVAAGSTVTLTGTGDTLHNGAGDTSYVLNNGAGTDTVVEEGAGDISNDQNAGTGAVAVTLNSTGAYVGLLGGNGYTVTGSNARIETWDNTSFNVFGNNNAIGTDAAIDNGVAAGSNADVHGAANTISLGDGDSLGVGGGGNVVNLGGLNNTVFLTGTGGNADTVNGSTDSGAGRASDGQQVGIFLNSNTQADVHGTGDAITVQSGDSLGVGSGGGNVISNVGANDTIFLTGTAGLADTITGSNDSGTGTAANGQQAGIFLDSNTQANLSGSGDTVSLGTNSFLGLAGQSNTVSGSVDEINAGPSSTGNLIGTNDTLNLFGNSEAFGVFNSAGGNNTVNENGVGDVVNAQNQAGGTSLVTLNSTNDYAGLLGGNGYTVTGVGGTVATWQNTGFSVAGYNDGIYTAQGDTAAVVGGGNTIVAGASTAVIVGGTGSDADAIYSNVPSNSGPAASGLPAGITVLDNAQATVVGDGNSIETGTSSNLGTIGDGNAVVAGADATVAINGNYNQYASLSGGSVTFAGMNNTAALNNTALYSADGNPITFTGVTSDLGNVQAAIDQSPAVANQIDDVYEEVLGRSVDPQGLAQAQAALIAGSSLADVRTTLATSQEALSDFNYTLSSIGADAPTPSEVAGFESIMSSAYDVPVQVISHEGTVLADTSATNLLAELPVLETLDNGRTLSLGLDDGSTISFQDTAHLTDFLYGVAVQQSKATSFVTDTFNQDISWLNQVDQPMLEVSRQFDDLGDYNAARGDSGQATLSYAAAQVALSIAGEAPGSRTDMSEKVAVNGHETEVTVFAGATSTSDATFHDIDPGALGILETVGIAVLNIAAVVSGNPALFYAAGAADLALAGQDFANGEVLEGILSLASAAGSIASGIGATSTAQIINTASEAVGGVYGAVQSAQTGDPLGIIAGTLETTAAVASGIAQYTDEALHPFEGPGVGLSFGNASSAGDPNNPFNIVDDVNPNASTEATINHFATMVSQGLNAASTALSVSDAFAHGNLTGGLLSSLSSVIEGISSDYQQDNGVDPFSGAGSNPASQANNLPFGTAPDNDGDFEPYVVAGPPSAGAQIGIAYNLIGTDAHNTLGAYVADRFITGNLPSVGSVSINTNYDGVFGPNRPDIIFKPADPSQPLEIFELKPTASALTGVPQLQGYVNTANSRLGGTVSNPAAVVGNTQDFLNLLGGMPGITLTSPGFLAGSIYSYQDSGLPGIISYIRVDQPTTLARALNYLAHGSNTNGATVPLLGAFAVP